MAVAVAPGPDAGVKAVREIEPAAGAGLTAVTARSTIVSSGSAAVTVWVAATPATVSNGLLQATTAVRCAPSPSKVSIAKPSHWVAGSNASVGTVSPASTVALRRRVLSAVLASPLPHSVPGSTPTWPSESITVGTAAQHDRVVAVPEAGPGGLVGLREDRGGGCLVGEDEHVVGGDRAGQVDREPGGGRAVEEHLQAVRVRRQVDRGAGSVVELDRLVVGRALDVFGDEQVGGRGRCRRHGDAETGDRDEGRENREGGAGAWSLRGVEGELG